MIQVSINTSELQSRVERIKDFISTGGQQDFLRFIAVSMLPVVKERIHVEGKAADGSQIGTYSRKYLKYTRPKYNRTGDSKVVVSLTRQMENDFSVVAGDDSVGLGYKNDENLRKSQYVESTYKKKIFALTEQEKELAHDIAEKYVSDALLK